MFNVTRAVQEPACLKSKVLNEEKLLKELESMFFGKCYLCEQTSLNDPQVEHFIPHENNVTLKYKWDNLFYACSRCNSIKSNTHTDLVNCCDASVNVFAELKHSAYECYEGIIKVSAVAANPSKEITNTVKLLKECFNSKNTGHRGISRENLLEKIQEYDAQFKMHRIVLMTKTSTDSEVKGALEKLEVMCRVNFPFSVFWKWHVIGDITLNKRYKNIRQLLKF